MLYDLAVNSWMVSIENLILINFLKFVSWIFEPGVLIILSLILSVFIYVKISKRKAIIFSLSMIFAGIFIKVFKELFQRARPLNQLIAETGFSFPSGHATASVVFFGMLVAIFCKKKFRSWAGLTALVLVLIVSFARIYLRVHWFTDVVGGWVLGGIILILSVLILKD